jgi:hypothetical protein
MAGFKSKKPRTGFSRPTTNAGQVDREWKEVYPSELASGDILAGRGIVISVNSNVRPFIAVEAGYPESEVYNLDELEYVKAFVRKDS